MELGSHPDLESIPDDVASISDFVGSALKGASAPLPSSLKEPSASSADSDKALRRLLLKQMPCVEVSTRLRRLAGHVCRVLSAAGHRGGTASHSCPLCKFLQKPPGRSCSLLCTHPSHEQSLGRGPCSWIAGIVGAAHRLGVVAAFVLPHSVARESAVPKVIRPLQCMAGFTSSGHTVVGRRYLTSGCIQEGGEPGGPSQRLASRGASFSEVLESCMRSNSSAASRRGRRQPVDVFAEPFIPVTSQSLSGE